MTSGSHASGGRVFVDNGTANKNNTAGWAWPAPDGKYTQCVLILVNLYKLVESLQKLKYRYSVRIISETETYVLTALTLAQRWPHRHPC